MNYSLEKIRTVEACGALLTLAYKKRESLERRRRKVGETIDKFYERYNYLGEELASVQLLLETFTTAYDRLPEGKYKTNMNVEIKRLEFRKARLDRMSVRYNLYSLLRKQIDFNLLDRKVTTIEAWIAAIQDKRTALNIAARCASHAEQKPLKIRYLNSTKFRLKTRPPLQQVSFHSPWWHNRDSHLPLPTSIFIRWLDNPGVDYNGAFSVIDDSTCHTLFKNVLAECYTYRLNN
jgi:hypothetical protein